jgi:hypothetical protein
VRMGRGWNCLRIASHDGLCGHYRDTETSNCRPSDESVNCIVATTSQFTTVSRAMSWNPDWTITKAVNSCKFGCASSVFFCHPRYAARCLFSTQKVIEMTA